MRRSPAVVLALVAVAANAAAQDQPPHCRFAPAIAVSALGPPSRMEGIGTSALPITTASLEAQQFFNQGLNLLHGFWDTEAFRAFREAARLDPNAAMAWWGVHTALGQNGAEMAAERQDALARAAALASTASEHEQFYVRAASALADPQRGRAAYIAEMEALIDRYPEDVEAQLLLANALSTSVASYAPDGRPREGKLYGQMILRNLLRTHPDHAAVHHYWIHAVENGPRPELALDSSRILPRLAPGIGHMLHMPGHIHYRLGDYEAARQAFLRSMAADERYMARERMHPVNTWNYIHNLDYMIAAAAESGRFEEGMKHAVMLRDLTADPARRRAQGIGYLIYGGHTAVARLQMRYGRWRDAAAALRLLVAAGSEAGTSDALLTGYYGGLLAYVEGMAAARADDLTTARARSEALAGVVKGLAQERPAPGGDWYFRHAVRVLEVQSVELAGVIQSRAGEHASAIATLTDAVRRERDLGYWEPPHYTRPVLESLGEAQSRAGNWDAAREAFERALKLRPHSGHPLLGLARAAARAGRDADARDSYRRLAEAWTHADPTLPELREAHSWLRR